MDLYDMIFKRRSVRIYEQTSLSIEELTKIQNCLDNLNQLNHQKAKFRIITPEKMGLCQAPYYIVASCEDNTKSYINIGYSLEYMDLYLQSIGLGSVWLGSKMPIKKEKDDCIVMAFGRTKIPYRKNEKEFNRLSITKICNQENEITKAIRLAPSAVNSQPWKIDYQDKKIEIHYHGRGPLKLALAPKMNKIDIGIMTCFVETTLKHFNKKIKKFMINISKKQYSVTIEYE